MALDLAVRSTAPRAAEPQTLASFSPIPPPPPAPPIPPSQAMYLPAPPHSPVLVPRPLVFRLDPAFLAQMDVRRSLSLLRFMVDGRAVPSPEEERRREQVICELKKIVLDWAKKVAYQHRIPRRHVASTTATIVTYGSYALGAHGPESDIDALCVGPCIASLQAHGPESDIDALCVGPCIASLQHHFFVVLRQVLEDRPEVSELHSVKSAKVPLMRFKFNGILVDFPYVQLPVINASEAINSFNPRLLEKVDESSWRSLSGVRVNTQILQLVPNLKKFQFLLRCVKLWARRRGLHCHLLGFFGGIHLAILAAYICRRHPNASVNTLFTMFFEIFSHWPWPFPVTLHDQPSHCWSPDGRSLMPIMMPCIPPEFCSSNITKSTFNKIKEEFQRGYALTRDLSRLDLEWTWLFAPFPYAVKYEHFLRIVLSASDADELRDWVGWVKSRFRNLLLKLESMGVDCDPDPTEQIDHNVSEPNVVFYWGLMSRRSACISTSSLRDDFMKSVINDIYGKERCTHSNLTMSIVGPSQLPKSMCSHSICSRYLPCYFVGYQPTDQDC